MEFIHETKVESETVGDFARAAQIPKTNPSRLFSAAGPGRERLNINPDNVKNGLGRLVLTLIKLIHELLERQAIRRVESGSLDEDQVEELGLTLMRQMEEIERLRNEFGLDEKDLNLDLGPLGKLF